MNWEEANNLKISAEIMEIKGKIPQAMKIYKKIKRIDNCMLSKRVFVQANYKIGGYYQYELRKLKDARNYYNNILEKDNREKYIDAQFELLNIAFDLNEFDEAERALIEIKRLSGQPWFNGRKHYEAGLFNFALALKKIINL